VSALGRRRDQCGDQEWPTKRISRQLGRVSSHPHGWRTRFFLFWRKDGTTVNGDGQNHPANAASRDAGRDGQAGPVRRIPSFFFFGAIDSAGGNGGRCRRPTKLFRVATLGEPSTRRSTG